MSNSVASIDSVLAEIQTLKQRVRDLERANRVIGAIPRGQAIYVLDVDGDLVAIIGGENGGSYFFDSNGSMIGAIARDGNGNDGVFFGDLEGALSNYALVWYPNRGIVHPAFTAAFQRLDQTMAVTSASFVDISRARINVFTAADIEAEMYALCPVGTTGEIRLEINGVTTTTSLTADGAVHLYRVQWTPALTLGVGPYYANWQLRRTGGAGTIQGYPALEMAMGDYASATGSGAWSVF